jgi:hypothetical protein
MTTAQVLEIADGDAGVRQTVDKIAELIRSSVATPVVRQAATAIVGSLPPNDFLAQMYAIREYLASSIVFLRDPAGVELLHTPEWLLTTIAQQGAAHVDCDDVAILGGALAGAVGLRVALTTVAFLDSRNPNTYNPLSHIWTAVTAPTSFCDRAGEQIWIDLDVTRPMQALPIEAIARYEVQPVLM